MDIDTWEPTPGSCLLCGGRGGWWNAGADRTTCTRCGGAGWDPDRHKSWFLENVLPRQQLGRD